MRQAPPVGVTCCGRGGWRVAGTVLAGAAAAALIGWASAWGGLQAPAQAGAALVAASVAMVLAWRLGRSLPVRLQWDGAAWRMGDTEGRLTVALDLGPWLLLRFDALSGPVRWLPVGAVDAGSSWHGLRCAVYAPPPSASAPAADAGAGFAL